MEFKNKRDGSTKIAYGLLPPESKFLALGSASLMGIPFQCCVFADGIRALSIESAARILGFDTVKELEAFLGHHAEKFGAKNIEEFDRHRIRGFVEAGNFIDILFVIRYEKLFQDAHRRHWVKTLFSGFTEVGLFALIDELTGYQHLRPKNELQTMFNQLFMKD